MCFFSRFSVEILSRKASAYDLRSSFNLGTTNNNTIGSSWKEEENSSSEIGMTGIGLTLVIQKVSNMFCQISQVKIYVAPNS